MDKVYLVYGNTYFDEYGAYINTFGVFSTLEEAEKMVINGFKSPIAENKELDAEGLVLRPTVQLFNRKNERIMVKIKTCDYRKLGIKS